MAQLQRARLWCRPITLTTSSLDSSLLSLSIPFHSHSLSLSHDRTPSPSLSLSYSHAPMHSARWKHKRHPPNTTFRPNRCLLSSLLGMIILRAHGEPTRGSGGTGVVALTGVGRGKYCLLHSFPQKDFKVCSPCPREAGGVACIRWRVAVCKVAVHSHASGAQWAWHLLLWQQCTRSAPIHHLQRYLVHERTPPPS